MGEFKVGLCGCFSNMGLCCYANCLAPLTVGKIAESFGEKQPVLWAMAAGFVPCIGLGLLRTRIRERDGIEGKFMADCCTAMLFQACVVHQLAAHTGAMDPILPKEHMMQRVAPE
ncbi:uncharacterized protein LOC144432015 [Styela clava]